MPKKNADLLVFDLDGTLVDSKKDIAKAFNCVLEDLGRSPISEEEIGHYIGIGVQSLLRQMFEGEGPDLFAKVLALFAQYYEKHLLDETVVYEGVFEVLEHFRNKPKVILTNKRQRFADQTVEGLGLKLFFSEVFGREYFSTSKPHPGPLLEISQSFSVPLSRMVMIGDTEVDMKAGKEAGVITAAAMYGYGQREALTRLEPDLFVDRPSEFTKVLF